MKVLLSIIVAATLVAGCGSGGGQVDVTAPVITVNGGSVTIPLNGGYNDAGATAADTYNNITTYPQVITSNPVVTSTAGVYNVVYTATDAAGNTATATRTVTVSPAITGPDTSAPIITVNGGITATVLAGVSYVDAGASATDDGGSVSVTSTGNVNTGTQGVYVITYTATDAAGNTATATRTVTVVDSQSPVITLVGSNPLVLEFGDTYVEPGSTVADNLDTGLTAIVSGVVNTALVNDYTITYTVTDSTGNSTTTTRTVKVMDTTPPVVSLIGSDITIEVNTPYTELGATATDIVDGFITPVATGNVDTSVLGTYVVTYVATDSAGNAGQVSRNVTVEPLNYTVFPPTTSVAGSIEIYTVTGTVNGVAFDGTVKNTTVLTGAVLALNGNAVDIVQTDLIDNTNAVIGTSRVYYASGLNYVEGVTGRLINQLDTAVPDVGLNATYKVGDSAAVGVYGDSAGVGVGDSNADTVSLALTTAPGTDAIVTLKHVIKNQFGVLLDTLEVGYQINQAGDRSQITVVSAGQGSLNLDLTGYRSN